MEEQDNDTGRAEELSQLLDAQAPTRRADAETLISLMSRVSGESPTVDRSIVGFGRHHYTYDSGREGDAATISFAMRKAGISIYFLDGLDNHQQQLERLGPHRAAKSCLSIKKLADVDLDVLESMIARSYAASTG